MFSVEQQMEILTVHRFLSLLSPSTGSRYCVEHLLVWWWYSALYPKWILSLCLSVFFFSVSCSVSFHLIISQKVTLYLQPHNIIIWAWHASLAWALNLCSISEFRPLLYHPGVFSPMSVSVCVFTKLADINSGNPDVLQSQVDQMWISSQPSGDTIQEPQDWHRELKLVFFGPSCHDSVPWSLENPHGFSHTVSSTMFSSSVTRRLYIDVTLQIKGGDKSSFLFGAGGDSSKCSVLSNLTAGGRHVGSCCKTPAKCTTRTP